MNRFDMVRMSKKSQDQAEVQPLQESALVVELTDAELATVSGGQGRRGYGHYGRRGRYGHHRNWYHHNRWDDCW